jgi:hypothetical protein
MALQLSALNLSLAESTKSLRLAEEGEDKEDGEKEAGTTDEEEEDANDNDNDDDGDEEEVWCEGRFEEEW